MAKSYKKGRLTKEPPETRDIPGFAGKYGVSFEGVVYRHYASGSAPLIPTIKRGNPVVRLERPNGTRQEMLVARAVQLAWLGPAPPGKVRYHRNGDKTDNIVGNIGFISRSALGKKTGGNAKRRPVLKVEPQSGEIVAAYPSARQAAKDNFMSYQTVMDCCNRKNKRPVAPDGFRYSWESLDD